jgi:hypothetical protein
MTRAVIARAVMAPAVLLVALLAMTQPLLAGELTALHDYFENTLIWQNQATGATGRIWLNQDGHYFAFYNLGPQAKAPDVHGPFQVEGRLGTFTLRTEGGASQLCLWPASPRVQLSAQMQRELYSESACYDFAPHAVGDIWTESADPLHRSYKFWLVKGR